MYSRHLEDILSRLDYGGKDDVPVCLIFLHHRKSYRLATNCFGEWFRDHRECPHIIWVGYSEEPSDDSFMYRGRTVCFHEDVFDEIAGDIGIDINPRRATMAILTVRKGHVVLRRSYKRDLGNNRLEFCNKLQWFYDNPWSWKFRTSVNRHRKCLFIAMTALWISASLFSMYWVIVIRESFFGPGSAPWVLLPASGLFYILHLAWHHRDIPLE